MKLSERAKALKPSPTLALAAKAKELKAEGHDVISLSVGEPDWDSFQVAKAAGIRAIEEGHTKYTPASGTPEFRKAIAKQTNEDLKTKYDFTEVTVSSGGKFILFSALQCLLDQGDEVIIPAPFWVSYPTMVELAEGTPRVAVCGKDSGFKLTPEILREHLSERTKCLILNSPSNPTGVMYSAEDLKGLADVLRDYPDVYIISDDIYNRLVLDTELAPHILHVAPELGDRVLVVNGASKTYSMTGWRIGWALGDPAWIKAMTNYQSQSTSGACTISQKAAMAAVEEGQPELEKSLVELKRRRDFVLEAFNKIPDVEVSSPDGAFYIWPDISKHLGKSLDGHRLETSSEFAAALLEDQKVVAVPGVEFGLDGFLRISYALKDERMQEAADRITEFVGKLK